MCGGAASVSARFDAVYDKEMMRPLEGVQVEVCEDACCVEPCFGDKFVRRVSAEGEEGGETGNGG
jgi:hypothetical protein